MKMPVRTVYVTPPSFPQSPKNELLQVAPQRVWQVLCGDSSHWRAGMYSPSATSRAECTELEKHTCPELFLLVEGHVTLLLYQNDALEELELVPGRPVLVTCPHSGFCKNGPHTGKAFVVERDEFVTTYERI